ncbi:hypothetical protein ALC53_13752 [Atta colombica]|uniref:Uncharacterized protein n=1 Tax=Atta colombica TaxID=520822 RepID=A0A195AUN7_9HYME|nr:hypothetical protein ALC53_13752 [Atta colombica]
MMVRELEQIGTDEKHTCAYVIRQQTRSAWLANLLRASNDHQSNVLSINNTMPVRFDPATIRTDFTRKNRIRRILWKRYRPPRKMLARKSHSKECTARTSAIVERAQALDFLCVLAPELKLDRSAFSDDDKKTFSKQYRSIGSQCGKCEADFGNADIRFLSVPFVAAGSETVPAMRQEYERGDNTGPHFARLPL